MDRDENKLAWSLMRIAVVGGGWSGLAAAVTASDDGHKVTLFEMAARVGGRARRVDREGLALDNGQHILIGAYAETLRLMRLVGAKPEQLLLRMPLRLVFPEGHGLRLLPGSPVLAFPRAVIAHQRWCWRDKLALLGVVAKWASRGFRCDATLSVAQLCAMLPASVRSELIDPLCIAALNTPAAMASASVFLRVLRDALFSGPGSSDLLLPKTDLSELWPNTAAHWLARSGARCQLSRRVEQLEPSNGGWCVDGEFFDTVVLAASAHEAARLVRPIDPAWSACAAALRYEPIVTVTLRSVGTRLSQPILALYSGAAAPAQFVFDQGQLRTMPGVLTFVISGASAWVDRGLDATVEATLTQAQHALGPQLQSPLRRVSALTEKRATFLCTPGLIRPTQSIAKGLIATGDYVAGPYPATLEGAVRLGVMAAKLAGAQTALPTVRR